MAVLLCVCLCELPANPIAVCAVLKWAFTSLWPSWPACFSCLPHRVDSDILILAPHCGQQAFLRRLNPLLTSSVSCEMRRLWWSATVSWWLLHVPPRRLVVVLVRWCLCKIDTLVVLLVTLPVCRNVQMYFAGWAAWAWDLQHMMRYCNMKLLLNVSIDMEKYLRSQSRRTVHSDETSW